MHWQFLQINGAPFLWQYAQAVDTCTVDTLADPHVAAAEAMQQAQRWRGWRTIIPTVRAELATCQNTASDAAVRNAAQINTRINKRNSTCS